MWPATKKIYLVVGCEAAPAYEIGAALFKNTVVAFDFVLPKFRHRKNIQ
jgi:hypothetical protein